MNTNVRNTFNNSINISCETRQIGLFVFLSKVWLIWHDNIINFMIDIGKIEFVMKLNGEAGTSLLGHPREYITLAITKHSISSTIHVATDD